MFLLHSSRVVQQAVEGIRKRLMLRRVFNPVKKSGLLDPKNEISALQDVLRNRTDLRIITVIEQGLKGTLSKFPLKHARCFALVIAFPLLKVVRVKATIKELDKTLHEMIEIRWRSAVRAR